MPNLNDDNIIFNNIHDDKNSNVTEYLCNFIENYINYNIYNVIDYNVINYNVINYIDVAYQGLIALDVLPDNPLLPDNPFLPDNPLLPDDSLFAA